MSYPTQRPHIATYVILRKEDKIAFLLRQGTDWMDGYYGLPAGKVEKHETFVQGAIREAKEEVGVELNACDLVVQLVAHRRNKGNHAPYWVDVMFTALKWQGKPYNAEPHLHSKLVWLDPNKLPKNVIPAIKVFLKAIANGQHYMEYGWDE